MGTTQSRLCFVLVATVTPISGIQAPTVVLLCVIRYALRLGAAVLVFCFCTIAEGQPVPCTDIAFDHSGTPSPINGLWNLDIGDLDGDGDLDLVAVGMYDGGAFIIYKNRGDGTFEEPAVHIIGEDPRCILLRDIDSDSDLDIIVSNSLGHTVFIYTNSGNGVFTAPSATYEFAENVRPLDFVAGDLDGDGDPDIAVDYTYGSFILLWNRGDGHFEPGATYVVIPGGGTTYEYVAEDLDGDSDLDLAVVAGGGSNPGRVYVLKNNGSGGFGDLQGYETPRSTTLPLAAADLDGDGDLDLAGANNPNARPDPVGMWLIFNDGTGHFGPAIVYPVGPWPYDVNFADLDRDGDLDAVVANQNAFESYPPPHDVSILLNRGDGTFDPEKREVVGGERPIAAIPVDLDKDLDLDIAVANFGWNGPSTISVLFNLCDPCDLDSDGEVGLVDCATFSGCLAGPGSHAIPECASADFDGDGDVDLRDWRALAAAFSR